MNQMTTLPAGTGCPTANDGSTSIWSQQFLRRWGRTDSGGGMRGVRAAAGSPGAAAQSRRLLLLRAQSAATGGPANSKAPCPAAFTPASCSAARAHLPGCIERLHPACPKAGA